MTDATIAISILWVFLFVYSLLGSVDFGAGFWSMIYGRRSEDGRAAELANRYLSPSWKVTNTFLVLFVVALVGFFPGATLGLASVLLVPVCLVLVLLTLRSAFLVYGYSVHRYGRTISIISGVTGLLIPGLLVSVLPVTLGGFIMETPDGGLMLDFGKLLASPTLYAHLAFGYATELFFSALFLADYSREARDAPTYRIYRRWAVIFGPFSLLTALAVTLTVQPEAAWIVAGFREQWLGFTLSAAAFVIGYACLFVPRQDGWNGHSRAAVVLVILQYAFASYAYGRAHLPYIIYPQLTIEASITNPAIFRSLLISYIVSALLLVPVFYLFWKLFLKDRRYFENKPE
ncbi:cytochrome d ubiquinol oxidase subunit II [Paenibacillus thiaminolyticus]|uniref:cytochrome d ubiquinol oxidase subunit II n=1 Tax=Paenibacillus thiaminolyticus TaxID=49283 RepID=UPI002542F385|nr:cytochrome d ubiquinol oxidase subunit II [Paenibacillus thiaminolyticus]WII36929.1 cytochrome d ubiquinol oxidase subunit II [Paenibacillus thiaminolyticus]